MSAPAEQFDARGLPAGYPFNPDWEVTPRQVRDLLAGGEDFLLLDCRTPPEYEVARIEGAALLPLQEIAARIDELAPSKEMQIVVHCHHGVRSLQMAAFLRRRGFADVWSMAGGIDLWSLDVDPQVPRY